MLIDFIKMHAQGNDFVILDHPDPALMQADHSALALAICDRRIGFGADGLVLLTDSEQAAAGMIIYNSDGSRAAMCGSALRCLTLLLAERSGKSGFEIQTDSGLKACRLEHDQITTISLGKPEMLDPDLRVDDFRGSLVDVGNLHYVIYTDELADAPHLLYGAALERHPAFPRPVNVHFVKLSDPQNISMAIWESGAGATLACGTGATAAVLTGIMRQGLELNVNVRMPGGSVRVSMNPQTGIFELSGAVTPVGTGQFRWKV